MKATKILQSLGFLVIAVVLAGSSCPTPPIPSPPIEPYRCDDPPPPPAAEPEAGAYIVVLKPGGRLEQPLSSGSMKPLGNINGFALQLTASEVRRLQAEPDVLGVFPDTVKSVPPMPDPEVIDLTDALSWGIDRIDQRALPMDGQFDPRGDGQGVNLWVVDTGIDDENESFRGRLGECQTVVVDAFNCRDDHGHGTHVAGTAAGSQYGVARGAAIHSMRVLQSGQGYDSWIIEGINRIAEWHTANGAPPTVVNMSLGGSPSWPFDYAICQAIQQGIHFVVAAGNEDNSACHFSPARVWQANTVSCTDRQDERCYVGATDGDTETNPDTGRPICEGIVDLFAPGWQITSDRRGGGGVEMSGTSMSSPHVAGVAAVYLGIDPSLTTDELAELLKTEGLPVVGDSRSKSNLLTYVGR